MIETLTVNRRRVIMSSISNCDVSCSSSSCCTASSRISVPAMIYFTRIPMISCVKTSEILVVGKDV